MSDFKFAFEDEEDAVRFIACIIGVIGITNDQWEEAIQMYEDTKHIDIGEIQGATR